MACRWLTRPEAGASAQKFDAPVPPTTSRKHTVFVHELVCAACNKISIKYELILRALTILISL